MLGIQITPNENTSGMDLISLWEYRWKLKFSQHKVFHIWCGISKSAILHVIWNVCRITDSKCKIFLI